MRTEYDLIIHQGQMRDKSGTFVDIGIQSGKIGAIAEKIDADARLRIDAGGNLVTESFVNPHLHLCKVYTLQMMDEEALKDYHATSARDRRHHLPASRRPYQIVRQGQK